MLSYCGELVKTHDPDRFFMTALMPPEKREALWALYAFNYEIAKTREIVTDTTLGLIRLQWWKDGIAEIYDGKAVRQNEILPSLAHAIARHDLPREWFEKLCYAREFDLEDAIPANLEGVRNYADFTHTSLNALAMKVLELEDSDECLRDVSIGYALAGLLKAVPYHASSQRCYLPADLLAKLNIPERDLYEFKANEALQPVIKAVADDCRAVLQSVEPHSKLLKLQKKSALMVCDQVRKSGYDVFDGRFEQKPPFFHLRLFLTF